MGNVRLWIWHESGFKMKNWKRRKTCPHCRGRLKRIDNGNHLNLLHGSECENCCATMYDNGISYAPMKSKR